MNSSAYVFGNLGEGYTQYPEDYAHEIYEEFQAKAEAWYYAELLRDERKRQKLTQQELGERIGKKREYISSLERGQTDMQLSTFMLIANALGLRFSLVVG